MVLDVIADYRDCDHFIQNIKMGPATHWAPAEMDIQIKVILCDFIACHKNFFFHHFLFLGFDALIVKHSTSLNIKCVCFFCALIEQQTKNKKHEKKMMGECFYIWAIA